jgi:hypothetical protein
MNARSRNRHLGLASARIGLVRPGRLARRVMSVRAPVLLEFGLEPVGNATVVLPRGMNC